MRYCGSKRKFMKYLRPILTKDMDENTLFVDLFGGGMNVVCDIPSEPKIAVDYNKYVIALWKELQKNGMKNIPTEVSEEMYNDVKSDYINHTNRYEDYIIGYVGTCCSFGGSWFNGYARFNPNKNEDHIKEAYNGLKKQVENFIGFEKTVFCILHMIGYCYTKTILFIVTHHTLQQRNMKQILIMMYSGNGQGKQARK